MMKKVLLVGNMGYVGSALTSYLRLRFSPTELIGFDLGIFAHCLTTESGLPEKELGNQFFGDVRNLDRSILQDVSAVVYLAAISNDPMGAVDPTLTRQVNYEACIEWAKAARAAKVGHFIFASSCSVYGKTNDEPKTESDPLNPLTEYAHSKIAAERDLEKLARDDFVISSLRFATACGFSPRLRLDLVLNDFVSNAIFSGNIKILSDGTPWRPLIHVHDMSRAIDWAISRDSNNGGKFIAVNVGSNSWNYTVSELATHVTNSIENTTVNINGAPVKDDRSYKVDFSLFSELAPQHQPLYTLDATIADLATNSRALGAAVVGPNRPDLYRIHTLKNFLPNA